MKRIIEIKKDNSQNLSRFSVKFRYSNWR